MPSHTTISWLFTSIAWKLSKLQHLVIIAEFSSLKRSSVLKVCDIDTIQLANVAALLFLQESPGLTVQDAVNLFPLSPSLWLVYPYVKPVYLCELHFGAMSSLLLLSRSCVEVLWPLSLVRTWCFVHSMDLQPFALSLVRTWCSLSIVWTYSLSPLSLVRTWCFLSIVWINA